MHPGPALNDPPLHDARVFAARGDEVAVVTEEVNIGDVTAMPTVHVAGSLGRKTQRELNAKPTMWSRKGLELTFVPPFLHFSLTRQQLSSVQLGHRGDPDTATQSPCIQIIWSGDTHG